MPGKADGAKWTRRGGSLRLSCLLGATIVAVAGPAAAHGASVKLTKHALVYEAAAGEVNTLTITSTRIALGGGRSVSGFSLFDLSAPLTAGAGCRATSQHTVTCPAERVTMIVAKGNDLPDALVNETGMRSRLDGGAGHDAVVGGSAGDVLYGGNAEDVLTGRGGDDTIKTRGFWMDVVTCGSGRDTVFADWSDLLPSGCETVLRASR